MNHQKSSGDSSRTGKHQAQTRCPPKISKEETTTLTSKLNELIVGRDKVLTEGFLVPIEKPGMDARKPENHRPVILLSAYRKLLSQIILRRINPIIESSISNTHFAYRSGRSTGGIVLALKYLVAGSLVKGFNRHCVGIDMSKAFDNVLRDNQYSSLKRSPRMGPEPNQASTDEHNIKDQSR